MPQLGSARALALCAPLLLMLVLPAAAQEGPQETIRSAESFEDHTGEEAARHRQLLRRSSSYLGPVGGIHVVEAGSGPAGSLRLQILTDFFLKDDYLWDRDEARYVGGALSLSVTPVEHLELSASMTMRKLRNEGPAFGDEPTSVQSIADPYLDVKTYGEVANGVTLGGDVLLTINTAPADGELDYAGMSVGLRGNLSFDLRRTAARAPLELRLNGGYYFDQSAKGIEQLERERFSALVAGGQSQPTSRNEEFRHLAYRNERFAYQVNRVDHASVAVGLEAPLELSKSFALHPILEWELWIPVNRQDYSCPLVELNGGLLPGDDSCLKREGASSWPHRLTAGARMFPGNAGFSLLAAVEIGLGGTKDFVRELAPTAPYRVMLGAAYTIDFAPKAEPVVTAIAPPPPPPKEGRLHGTVVEQGPGTPVARANVTFTGRDVAPIVTRDDGQFVSAMLPPGEVQLALEAEGYQPGSCSGRIPEEGGDATVRCELIALPRVGTVAGRVVSSEGGPIVGATVQVTGPAARSPVTTADGSFRDIDLAPGDYQARIDHEGFLISISHFHVDAGKESTPQITLVAKPKKSLVKVQKTQLKLLDMVYFNTDTAEIQARSEPLLTEVADALLRTPEVLRVEVQGHTDNVGAADYNLDLSQRRAEAVRDFLLRNGVEASRLEAKGYGLTKPIAPNKGEKGRSKNRRVAFIILERAAP
jgi:outer membrane protein OmpA-like peptidoglycan-associated protein